jgi:hypothetical protein
VQKLLGADEALVYFVAGDNESYVFALTRDGFEWRTIPIGAGDLSEKVAAFRRGLDVAELTRAANAGKPALFNLGLANELYAALSTLETSSDWRAKQKLADYYFAHGERLKAHQWYEQSVAILATPDSEATDRHVLWKDAMNVA